MRRSRLETVIEKAGLICPAFSFSSLILVLGVVAYALSNTVVGALGDGSPFAVTGCVTFGALLGMVVFSPIPRVLPSPRAYLFLALQVSAVFAFFVSLMLVPVSLVAIFMPLETVVAVFATMVFLKDRITAWQGFWLLSALVSSVGMAWAGTKLPGIFWIDLVVVIGSCVLYGLTVPALRFAARTTPPQILALYVAVLVVLISLPFVVLDPPSHWVVLVISGFLLKTVADIAYASGMALAPLALASCAPILIAVFTAFFGAVFLKEGLSLTVWVWSVAVIFSVALLALKRRKNT